MFLVEIYIMQVPYPILKRIEVPYEQAAYDTAARYYLDPSVQGYRITSPKGDVIDKKGVLQ